MIPTPPSSGDAAPLVLDEIRGEALRHRFSALLDQGFGLPAGRHFLDDFPVWDERVFPSEGALLRIGILGPGQKLVASACVRQANLRTPGGSLKIAVLGAVATDHAWRGRGLATQAVEFCVEWAASRGAAMVLLWGSEHSFYRKLGFGLCGTQVLVPLASLGLKASDIPVNRGWTGALFDCLRQRTSGLVLEARDRSWMEAHQGVDWFWTGPVSQPTAYAAIGRGIDLADCVHEWGGAPADLAAVLAKVHGSNPQAVLLSSRELLKFLPGGEPAPDWTEEVLCLNRVLDPTRILEAYRPGVAPAVLTAPDGAVASLAPLLFSGDCALPLWIWGLDSA